jgi:hypothetical protein
MALHVSFCGDLLKKDPWLVAQGTNLHAAESKYGSAFFMRIHTRIQVANLLRIHADRIRNTASRDSLTRYFIIFPGLEN